MNKKFNIVLAIILLFDFIMPCFIHRSFAVYNTNVPIDCGNIDGSKRIDISDQDINSGFDPINLQYIYPSAKFTCTESGLYTFDVTYNAGRPDYNIIDGNGAPLAVAAYVRKDDDIPEIGAQYLSTGQKKVTVYLEAGQTYYCPVYDYGAGKGAHYTWNITKQESPQPSDEYEIKEFDLSTDKYTNGMSALRSLPVATDSGIIYPNRGQTHTASSGSGVSTVPSGNFTIAASSNMEDLVGKQSVSIIEKLATLFFIYGICEPLRMLIASSFGEVTIDKLLFNDYPATGLTFYRENGRYGANTNTFINNTATGGETVLEMINRYFNLFRGFVIAAYLILLIYICIRILIKSTARDKDKFKVMLADWVKGVVILFVFPLIIKYCILINEAVVALINKEVKQLVVTGSTEFMPSSLLSDDDLSYLNIQDLDIKGSDLMEKYKDYALRSHSMGFAFVYFYLILSLFSFLMIYFKRLITILLLIVIFPFVAFTYAMDKVKDGKAQIFNNWFREFILNVFMQVFHAIAYVTVMAVITALMTLGNGEPNIILVIVGIGYIKKSDELLKVLFPNAMRGGGAGTVKPLSQVAKTATAISIYKQTTGNIKSIRDRFSNASEKHYESKSKKLELRSRNHLAKIGEKQEQVANENKEKKERVLDAIKIGLSAATPPPPTGRPAGAEGSAGGSAGAPADADDTEGTGSGSSTSGATGGSAHGGTNPESTTPQNTQGQISMEQIDAIAKVYNSNSAETRAKLKQDLERHGIIDPEQQRKIMDMVQAKVAMDELITGRTAKGVILSRTQLSANVKVITEIINKGGANPEPGTASHMMKEFLATSQISYKDFEYKYGHTKLSSREEYLALREKFTSHKDRDKSKLARLSIGEKKATRTVSGTEFLRKMQREYLVETEAQVQEMNSANSWIGGASGVRHARMEGTGPDRKVVDLEGAINADGDIVLDAIRTQTPAPPAEETSAMKAKEKEQLHRSAKNVDALDKMKTAFLPNGGQGGAVGGEELAAFTQASHILMDMREYQERMQAGHSKHIGGVDAVEMHEMMSKLNKLVSEYESVRTMVGAMVDTGKKDNTGASTFTPPTEPALQGLTVNLGCSLDVMEAESAQAIFSIPSESRTAEQSSALKSAGESLRRIERESTDDLARLILNRSERDDVLDTESLDDILDYDGFVEGEERTQEEKLHDRFIDEKATIRIQLDRESIAKLRADVIRSGIESAGAIASASIGTVTSISSGVAIGSMVAGASSETTASGVVASVNMGLNVEHFVEKAIPGSRSATKGTLGSGIADIAESIGERRVKKEAKKAPNPTVDKMMTDNAQAINRTALYKKNLKR